MFEEWIKKNRNYSVSIDEFLNTDGVTELHRDDKFLLTRNENLQSMPKSYRKKWGGATYSRERDLAQKYYNPKWDLVSGGNELIKFFDEIKFSENILNISKTNRVKK